jgi:hypothetical protein
VNSWLFSLYRDKKKLSVSLCVFRAKTQGSVNDNPAMGDDQNNTNNQNNNQNMAKRLVKVVNH